MLDRESTFADPQVIALLKEEFVSVAIDQWYHRRQQDTTGEFWRHIAGQGPRKNFENTTQGFYIVAADGTLIEFNNNRGPEHVRKLLQKTSREYQHPAGTQPIVREKVDARYDVAFPTGGAVVRVSARVEGGYEPTDDKWEKLFQSAVSRDNLWITAAEQQSLKTGTIPPALATRIARFHLVDNTRGEPSRWKPKEVRELDLKIDGRQLSGTAKLRTDDGKRGFDARLTGAIDFDENDQLIQFDLLVQGKFWGAGPFAGRPPAGKFPLAIAFTLADGSDVGDNIAPHASRGSLDGYLRPE